MASERAACNQRHRNYYFLGFWIFKNINSGMSSRFRKTKFHKNLLRKISYVVTQGHTEAGIYIIMISIQIWTTVFAQWINRHVYGHFGGSRTLMGLWTFPAFTAIAAVSVSRVRVFYEYRCLGVGEGYILKNEYHKSWCPRHMNIPI